MTGPLRGVFTIPSTPFDESGQLDDAGLRRMVDFCVACGAHGIVAPVNASEFTRLSDEERLRVTRLVVEQTAGCVPVVIGTAGVCTEHAVMFSRYAQQVGANAVIAMPPYVNKVDEDGALTYYRGISEAISLPIFVQNNTPPIGTDLSVKSLGRLVREIERVEYVKEETFPATHKLTQLRELAGARLKGVFGGAGGRYLLLEHPRGSAGNMPGCHVTDVIVRLWDALEAGRRDEAKRIYGLLAPLYAIEAQYPGIIYKQVLRRRGVIRCARVRNAPTRPLDEADIRALDEILVDLAPLFRWQA